MLGVLVLGKTASPGYLIVDRLLIGILKGTKWTTVGSSNGRAEGLAFREITFGPAVGEAHKGKLEHDDVTLGVFLMGDNLPEGVLYSGPVKWPRPVQILPNNNQIYSRAVASFLKSKRVVSKPRITKLVTTDLDGDGSKEVIIEASNRDNVHQEGMHGSEKGDYSVVLLRYVSKGKVVDYPVDFDYAGKAGGMMYRNTLRAIADFDGDGIMEFITTSDYYEGGGSGLVRFAKGKVKTIVNEGAGV